MRINARLLKNAIQLTTPDGTHKICALNDYNTIARIALQEGESIEAVQNSINDMLQDYKSPQQEKIKEAIEYIGNCCTKKDKDRETRKLGDRAVQDIADILSLSRNKNTIKNTICAEICRWNSKTIASVQIYTMCRHNKHNMVCIISNDPNTPLGRRTKRGTKYFGEIWKKEEK